MKSSLRFRNSVPQLQMVATRGSCCLASSLFRCYNVYSISLADKFGGTHPTYESDLFSNDLFSIFHNVVLCDINPCYIITIYYLISIDPWTRMITELASIPRLVGLIGVILLTTGVIASGYLATGGVGAYLASVSAGAVMGIGASFVIMQSEILLRKHFRVKLSLALTVKNVAASFGSVFVPALMHFLLEESGLKTGLLLMTVIFIPTALGTLTLRSPTPQRAPSYSLLLPLEEDNELGIRSSDITVERNGRTRDNGADNFGYVDNKQERNAEGTLFSEVNNIYAYEEPEEDIELFVNPAMRQKNKWWKKELCMICNFQFWFPVIAWIGLRAYTLFFWILLPILFLKRATPVYHSDWVMLPVVAGIATFIPSICSCWLVTTTALCRRLYFGGACWLGSLIVIGLVYANNYYWFLICSLLGGISINSLIICQDITLCDVMGNQFALRSHKIFSTLVGLGVLIFCIAHSMITCLYVTAILLLIGGCYWIVPPIWIIIISRWRRQS